MNRWAKARVLDRVFTALQEEEIIRINVEALSLDSITVQVHPDGTGAEKRTVRSPSHDLAAGGAPKFIWLPRMSGEL